MKQSADRMATAKVGSLRPRGPVTGLIPRSMMPSAGASTLNREVFGFASANVLGDPTIGYRSWNLSLLSTVAYFGLTVNGQDGTLVQTNTGWTVWHSSTASDFINAAHASGVKVVLTLIEQDQPTMCSALDHGLTTIDQVAGQLLGADGINIDYEGDNQTCPDGVGLRSKLVGFVQAMRARGLGYLTIDTYASSAEDGSGFFDIPSLAGSVDAFFVMDYDLELSNGPCPACIGPTSPLAGAPTYAWNVTRSANGYASWASKTILGFPYYGVKGCVQGPNPPPNAAVTGKFGADPYTTIVTYPTDPNITSWQQQRDQLDPSGEEPWASFYSGYVNCWREEYWDDALSLGHKYDLVIQNGMRGAGIFTLDYGGSSPELWNALQSHFVARPKTTFYFAEGNTLAGFNETLQLFMPNASGTAQVTYYTESGKVGPISHALTAGQVAPISVVGDVGSGHVGVSAQVVLPGPGVAERQLNFNVGNWHGSTDKVGVTGPNAEWDFAEGSTLSYFNEYMTLQNPDPTTASKVLVSYFTDQGANPTKTLTLPAGSRTTIEVFNGDLTSPASDCTIAGGVAQNCGVGPNVTGVSTQVKVTSGPAIIAERPMYVNGFSFGSGPIRDGHDAFGANSPATTWYFAEGTTLAGFNEYLTLQNSGSSISNVTVTYFTDSGASVTRTLQLPATSRTTLEVFKGNTAPGPTPCAISGGLAQNCGVGPGVGGVSTKVTVTSGPSVVAERPMYMYRDFGSGVVAGAHVVVGANSLAKLFGFAGAQTTPGENDYLTIQNPNSQPATLTITYYDAAPGFPRTVTVVVPPNTRRTVQVFATPSVYSGSVGPGFSELGIVASSNLPVLVERPTYSSVGSQYGATDTLGFTPNPAF